jgi:hypothetical protein
MGVFSARLSAGTSSRLRSRRVLVHLYAERGSYERAAMRRLERYLIESSAVRTFASSV